MEGCPDLRNAESQGAKMVVADESRLNDLDVI